MRSLALGLLLLVLSFPCAARAQARQSDVEQLGLKGRVKSLELWRVEYTIRDGSPKNREIRWYDGDVLLRALSGTTSAEFAYDARGNWTRRTFYLRPDGASRPEPYRSEQREIVYH